MTPTLISPKRTTIRCRGKIIDLSTPKVMGIVNATPDSFYPGSRCQSQGQIIQLAAKHISEGAQFIDLGAASTRPGCRPVDQETEWQRLKMAMSAIRSAFPDAIISVDTFRSQVAEMAVSEYGADMINDVSGGTMDTKMLETVARAKVPYILTHIKGTPLDMGTKCQYASMMDEITAFLAQRVEKLAMLGAADIIIDPGFGLGKNQSQNYELLQKMDALKIFGLPILAGISRKSMIYKLLGTTPQDSLAGTTAANTIAISKGASILRVHDVKPAAETIKICQEAGL